MSRTKGDIKDRRFKQGVLMGFLSIGKENAMQVSDFKEPLKWYSHSFISGVLGDLFRQGTISREPRSTVKGGHAFAYWIPSDAEKAKGSPAIIGTGCPNLTGITRLDSAIHIFTKAERLYAMIDGLDDNVIRGDSHDADMPSRFKASLRGVIREERNKLIAQSMSPKITEFLDGYKGGMPA